MSETFAGTYKDVTIDFQYNAAYKVNFACRGLKIAREMSAALTIGIEPHGISFFSNPSHRVTPIRFTLAELCWILAGRSDVDSIASYNKAMMHYAEDGIIMRGSYGGRLLDQLPVLIQRLKAEVYTRQACASIFTALDCVDQSLTHLPCNVFLQFLCRPPFLDLHVTSRSSDFVTGFSIDTIHWQALLILMANELRASGIDVTPRNLHYNIASLHVYENDMAMVDTWNVGIFPQYFGHFIPLTLTLSDAIARCKFLFTKDLTTMELAGILNLGSNTQIQLDNLNEMFKQHKNKVTR